MSTTTVQLWYGGDVIDQKEFKGFFVPPVVGDTMRISFSNPHNADGHDYWIVTERRVLYLGEGPELEHVLMLNVSPHPSRGLWKTDPLYGR